MTVLALLDRVLRVRRDLVRPRFPGVGDETISVSGGTNQATAAAGRADQPGSAATTVLWFRRDLRLADNPALLAAREAGDRVLGIFVLDPVLWEGAGAARRWFLAGALADLSRRLDGRLVLLHGDPVQVVPAAARHIGAAAVHVAAEFTPWARRRDAAVAEALTAADIAWQQTGSAYAVAPGRVRKGDGSPYRVFTPFSRAWRAHGWREPAAGVRRLDWLDYDGPHRGALPPAGSPDCSDLPEPTEAAARARWRAFRDDGLEGYSENRNDAAGDLTSRLSAYLHFGLLHPRTLLADLEQRGGRGPDTFRNELCWREFYADVLDSAPDTAWVSYDPRFRDFEWAGGPAAEEALARWQAGRTGYPMVDAGMRQLLAEGWMHNRLRMVVASFLVKDLHLPWQWGARHFLAHLVDGDLASNNFGWQWAAGTGTDAAPYVRVFNPVLQGLRYDPEGDYVRRWVPELRGLAGPAVHTPWEQAAPPADYPARIVDHAVERQDALRRYEAVRG